MRKSAVLARRSAQTPQERRTVWDRIGELLEQYDASIELKTASACCWSAELRLTLTDPRNEPSRSITFFAAGGLDPEMAAKRVLDDAEKWLAETTGIKPMPVPIWMRA